MTRRIINYSTPDQRSQGYDDGGYLRGLGSFDAFRRTMLPTPGLTPAQTASFHRLKQILGEMEFKRWKPPPYLAPSPQLVEYSRGLNAAMDKARLTCYAPGDTHHERKDATVATVEVEAHMLAGGQLGHVVEFLWEFPHSKVQVAITGELVAVVHQRGYTILSLTNHSIDTDGENTGFTLDPDVRVRVTQR